MIIFLVWGGFCDILLMVIIGLWDCREGIIIGGVGKNGWVNFGGIFGNTNMGFDDTCVLDEVSLFGIVEVFEVHEE